MRTKGLPRKQGLYDPQFEHDACGIGFIVNVKGFKSHQIITQALKILRNLTHRGGFGSEANTGDGAGILMQIPHRFFRQSCVQLGIDLQEPGSYGVGMLFLPQDEERRQFCECRFAEIVAEEGQALLGWRTVPVDPSTLGETAKSCMPFIRQVFIGRSPDLIDDQAFERKCSDPPIVNTLGHFFTESC
ncbi:MAG: glutamate synthase subunit alpha, partial [Firmicutes bacterium]|nr:glutamate synthase subunit alpha [Bacillota bacterium]